MIKRIGSLLFVGIVGYTLGTMSTLYAEKKVDNMGQVTKKLDQIVKGQSEIKEKLKQIWFKVK